MISLSSSHHVKSPLCLTRPPYRNGRKLRSIKVYTVAQESKYLLVQNIPSIDAVHEQLLPYFSQYGKIDSYTKLDDCQNEPFTQTFVIKFIEISQARRAKGKFDDWNFMGTNLHISYAPECETIEDLREKLNERRTIVDNKNRVVTTNEIRSKMRNLVQKSNLISLVIQQDLKKKKRLQI